MHATLVARQIVDVFKWNKNFDDFSVLFRSQKLNNGDSNDGIAYATVLDEKEQKKQKEGD